MDIEFVISDLFDRLQPKGTRFKTVEEALEALKAHDERYRARDKLIPMSEWNKGSFEMSDFDSDEDDSDMDDANTSDDVNVKQVSKKISVMSDSDEDDEDSWSRGEANSSKEDLDFQKEFQMMMAESVESRRHDRQIIHIADANSYSRRSAGQENEPDEDGNVVFKVLTRKQNTSKPITRDLLIPADCDFAINTKREEEAQREEQKQIKKLVIDGLERHEIEERENARQRIENAITCEPSYLKNNNSPHQSIFGQQDISPLSMLPGSGSLPQNGPRSGVYSISGGRGGTSRNKSHHGGSRDDQRHHHTSHHGGGGSHSKQRSKRDHRQPIHGPLGGGRRKENVINAFPSGPRQQQTSGGRNRRNAKS